MVTHGPIPNSLYYDHRIEGSQGSSGWVEVRIDNEDLYIGGSRAILRPFARIVLPEVRLYAEGVEFYDKHTEARFNHPNILEALVEHQHFIPERLRVDDYEQKRSILFPGMLFYLGGEIFTLRGMYWNGQKWGACRYLVSRRPFG